MHVTGAYFPLAKTVCFNPLNCHWEPEEVGIALLKVFFFLQSPQTSGCMNPVLINKSAHVTRKDLISLHIQSNSSLLATSHFFFQGMIMLLTFLYRWLYILTASSLLSG